VQFEVIKESGFTRELARADCASKGKRLANIYSQDEQDQLNLAITNAGGLERAFWLGMYENGPIADGNAAKDSDQMQLGFNGFRPDQPSNKLSHPNDKHSTGLYEDCVRQFGIEGWNDAICTRTWSGARKKNIMMGHVCEERSSSHSTQHINTFQVSFHSWVGTFLVDPKITAHWGDRKIDRLATRIKTRIMNRRCATQPTSFSGVSTVDPNGDGISQLGDIVQDMKDFFGQVVANCKPALLANVVAKLDRWETKLDAKFAHVNQ